MERLVGLPLEQRSDKNEAWDAARALVVTEYLPHVNRHRVLYGGDSETKVRTANTAKFNKFSEN